MPPTAPKSPTLVFVPGSWHKPICYSKIVSILQDQHALRCVTISLPSTSGIPSATFKEDVDTARHVIAAEISQQRDVVVVAHSYGGMVGNSAIKGFARLQSDGKSPFQQSTASDIAVSESDGHVIGLILIASGFTLTGLSFMDPFFGHPPPAWRINTETGFADIVVPPGELFYHDLPKDEQDYWVSQLTPQSLKSLFEGGEHSYAGWQDVPTWYIGTIEDRGLPVVVQRMQVGMARGMGGLIEHRELQTSHSPFLSQPQVVVDVIQEAIERFASVISRKESTSYHSKRFGVDTKQIIVPSVRIVRPYTWFKFGIPLAFGRALGWCIVIWGWGRRNLATRSQN
ncbi:alpha/beta-hydrolase [Lophiostoma macrostomum CBS 122681]|uniref:Alpha/beta-hydrolase n=1 Tax=Lophiostoma macrostomum CBS 122681 TaxID=1314788 RepID=A0A6A6SYY3_9PLEO|nr:alpha/beta-hydrolase [Lophiostoma macrostomum CBS 122681]